MDLLTRARQAFAAITRILKDQNISDAKRLEITHNLADSMQREITEFQLKMKQVSNDNGRG